jgi:hypothetical protein
MLVGFGFHRATHSPPWAAVNFTGFSYQHFFLSALLNYLT